MSLLRLSEGGRWKEAVFWQQPRNYWSDNMTSHYQGDSYYSTCKLTLCSQVNNNALPSIFLEATLCGLRGTC